MQFHDTWSPFQKKRKTPSTYCEFLFFELWSVDICIIWFIISLRDQLKCLSWHFCQRFLFRYYLQIVFFVSTCQTLRLHLSREQVFNKRNVGKNCQENHFNWSRPNLINHVLWVFFTVACQQVQSTSNRSIPT